MNIDVVDTTDPRLVQTRIDLEKLGTTKVFSYCGMSNGLNQMVFDIMSSACIGSIEALRIWGHGTPSVVGISSGEDPRVIRLHLTGISPGALASPHHQLARLRPYFAKGGRLELRGCQTGAGDDARKLMTELTNLLGVEVHASEQDQSMYGLNWFGMVRVIGPGGTIKTTSGIAVK